MKANQHRVHIKKEALKFSVAHMTVFPDGTKESLHGHNYSTDLSIDLVSVRLNHMISFVAVKKILSSICKEWDEKILIAKLCPFMENLVISTQEIEFKLCQKRYVLPADETVLLEIENISTEELSQEFGRRFLLALTQPEHLELKNSISSFQIRIEESPGQGASFIWQRHLP